ncbi:MAG TPA: hypothetical protein VIG99_20620 [Myxococcaceae bacterium]|jgi:hypothetical protein
MWSALALLSMALVGLVQLLPGAVALVPSLSRRFYGVALDDVTMALLTRHRAVLLALVGLLLFAGIAVPSLRTAAIVTALASKLSYVALHALGPPVTPEAARVARVDMITAPVLIAAAVVLWLAGPER